MKQFYETLGDIIKKDKGLFAMMLFLFALAMILMIYGLLTLKPEASVDKVGYGDIGRYQGGEWSSMANTGGYQDGSWANMLAYPLFALVLGILHNVIAVQMYAKKGSGMAKVFVMVSVALVIAIGLVLRRLLGEG